jgi:PAS domain S-box-containing protein
MTNAAPRILVVGGQVEDIRAIDAGVSGLGVSVDWVEPADAAKRPDAAGILAIVLNLDETDLALAGQIRRDEQTRHTPFLFVADREVSQAKLARAYALAPSSCLNRPLTPEVVQATTGVLRIRRRPTGGPAEAQIATPNDYLPGAAVCQIVQEPDGGRRFVYVSAGVETLFGVKADAVVADPYMLYGLIVPEDLPRVIATEAEASRTRTVSDCQFRQRTRSGDIRRVRWRSAPRVVGNALVWDGLITDATADHRELKALRKNERRFRRIGDSLPVLIWLAGADRKCIWFNRRWLDFTGETLEQAVEHRWAGGIHPDDRERCEEEFAAAFDAGRPFAMEYRLRRQDGAYRWVLDNGVPLRGTEEAYFGFIGSCVDITDRKQMEEALRQAERRREDYLAMLAHELRNPLTPLRNGLYVLSRRPDDPQVVTDTRAMMARQIENMSRIVDDLLDAARVARGKVTIRKARLDLTDVVRTCVDDRRAVAEGAGIRLVFAAPVGPVWVDGDTTRLSQVLDNLIHNAIKFTPRDGTVTVTVTADGPSAVTSVRDNGTGIEKGVLPQLFEVFSQADRSLDRSPGGLGLGLALVKGLVELHGGTVEAHSEGTGKGSEFIVRLERAPEPPALTEVPTSPSSVGRKFRVLVVEDNPDSAESLRMLLDLSGFEVEVANTGPAGVDAAARFRPHAVVCDIGLPGLDGYQVAQILRKQPELAGTRLIAVSGYGRPEDVEKARRAGFNNHMTKPVDPYDLIGQLSFRQ